MNAMFRSANQETLRPGDITRAGYEDWNGRINRAIASETAWRRVTWMLLLMMAGSVTYNVIQARESKVVQTVHVVHDQIGHVVTTQAEGDMALIKPTPAMVGAFLKDWVRDARTVGVDVMAMRRQILNVYKPIGALEAKTALDRFYQGNDPFKRAANETVNITDEVAIPPPPADRGKDDLQTWRVEWNELVTGRDGGPRSNLKWFLTVTFTVVPPKTVDEAYDDPDGIHLISFSWTQQ
jgi:type IV secretory pathway TrbF-like protein